MMTFLWWLFVVLVVALTQNVSSTTSVRSHYNSRGRIKGETTNDLERHLQVDEQRETKKHGGNILLTLDQVWTDASSVETKVKIKTTCKKPKKQKKSTDGSAVTGDGVGVGNGSGKGGMGGKGSGSSSNVNTDSAVTTNTTSSTTSSTSTNATSVTSGTANSNSTDEVYRLLQSNSTTSNVFGNKTSSTNTTTTTTRTNTTTSSGTSDSTPNTTFVITVSNVNGGKGGGKGRTGPKANPPKVSADDIPFCEEEDDEPAVTSPSAPVRSPGSSPSASVQAPASSPSASVQSPASSPSASVQSPASSPSASVQSPAMSSPIVSVPLTVPSGSGVDAPASAPSNDTDVVASVCEAYLLGAAPTDTPSQNHTTLFSMNVDVGSDINSIYSQMGTVLREQIGPLLLDCVSERRLRVQRKAQENATELVNVLFSDPTFTGESCPETPENATCVPSIFTSGVYFFGEEPVGFDEKLRQAMLFTDFDIPGLQSFASVEVSESVDEGDAEPEPAPVASPPTETAVETTQRSRNGPSPGVSVAVAVSLLALVLAALFVVRRHREGSSSDSLSKHIEFTDDFPDDAGAETADDNSANTPIPPPQKSYVVSDQSLDESWNAASRRSAYDGQEVYVSNPSSPRNRSHPETTFVEADGPDPRLMNLPRRFYESADTVNL